MKVISQTALTMLAALGCAAAYGDITTKSFKAPPNVAKPHTWFHMMNGNVTKEGITRDFEAIAKAGLGGVQMFDAGCNIPPGGLDFNSPEWFEMFKHAAAEAQRLGLEICIPNCSGWSSSGGPWNPPANGMKVLTHRTVKVVGPKKFSEKLPREEKDNGFYADIGVFAYPTPVAESVNFDGVKATIDNLSAEMTSDEKFEANGISIAFNWEGTAWSASANVDIEVSEDGKTFKKFLNYHLPIAQSGSMDTSERFIAFDKKISVKAIRLKVSKPNHGKIKYSIAKVAPKRTMQISNLKAKTFGWRKEVELDNLSTTADQVVAKGAVQDVTAKMREDGTLEWDVPAGEWTIQRVGYICNGRCNHPASDHGLGLEVDKLSAEAMDFHFEQYVSRLCKTLGPLAGNVPTGFNNILVDSYEVGSQNWTQKMEAEFLRRTGYSIRPYMPVFAGAIIDDVVTTERFLEDFRRVVADMFAEYYAGALTKKCHEYGLQCSIEPYGSSPSDNLQYGEYCDIPMGEFWSHAGNPYALGCGNSKFISYITHVWGRKFCGTESFTASPGPGAGRWMTTPFSIKAQGDSAFANGVNRIIYHRFTHQPWANDNYLPGMTMGRWGMHLDRTQTWWDFAGPWFEYQTRCQYMLQEGTFCADVLFFAGEHAPNQGGNTDGGAKNSDFYRLPAGYDHDICPTDAMYALKVENGYVVAPGGVKYRVLALPTMEAVSPKMLECVTKLRDAGATIVWRQKPVRAPGLKWGKDGDAKVRALADALWAKGVMACTPAEALKRLAVRPDFTVESNSANTGIEWLHRRNDKADWYFAAMPNREEAKAEISFRQTGRIPEIWDAETGVCREADVWREENGRTYVTVPFTVCGSKFVVFRTTPTTAAHAVACDVKAERRADPKFGSDKAHTLVIKSAQYGAKPDHVIDITQKVAAQVKDNEISVTVGNGLAGRDPIYLTPKKLFVTYVYDGVERTLEIPEHQLFTVPSGAGKAVKPSDYEWIGGNLFAWQPLTAKVTGADGSVRELKAEPPMPVPVNGAWKVKFPNKFLPNKLAKGADEVVDFAELESWNFSKNDGVKYFSGTATYEKTVPAMNVQPGARIVLDLGIVKECAEVTVNGKKCGILWKPPFRIDVTEAVKSGEPINLSIRVANLWANRLIGDDRQFADDCEWKGGVWQGVKEIGIKEIPQWVKDGKKSPTGRSTFTTWKHWDKNDELLPGGILGPVYLRTCVPAK